MKERLVFILLENGHLALDREPARKLPKALEKAQKQLIEYFGQAPEKALFAMGFMDEHDEFSPSLNFWVRVACAYVQGLRETPELETIRHKVSVLPDESTAEFLIEDAPFFQGGEYLSAEVLSDWWKALETFFKKEIKRFKGTVEDYLHQFSPDLHLVGKVHFHLVENRKGSAAPFAFLATYAAAVDTKGEFSHRPLQYALTEYEDRQEQLVELLSTVYAVADRCELLKGFLDSGELFYPLSLSSDDACRFLRSTQVYEEGGILCRIPNWWKRNYGKPKVSVSIGEKKKSLVGLDSLLDFKAKIALGDLEVTIDEARDILQQAEGLAFIKGKWVPVDHDKLARTLDQLDAARSLMAEGLTLAEAMRLMLQPDDGSLGLAEDEMEVGFGDWMQTVFTNMRHPERVDSVKPPCEFKATLRPYQETGLNWLNFLGSFGFGACLADDMGLGKTIQVLALLSNLRRKKAYSTSLLVVPASLIGNWCQELERFAPKIRFAIAHSSAGDAQLGKQAKAEDIAVNDLVITTYGLVKRYEWIRQFDWNYVMLDEAQAIKNPGTAQTKAIKALKSRNRLVLTGTPIENKLADLWSLFDFLNPGMLGNRTEFSNLVKRHQGNLSHVRHVVSPFILRRLKTDKSIISDLPDKIEMETYADLSKKQAVLYQDVVDGLMQSLEGAEGIQRKGLVLSSLMKFKQICNHPSQYLGSEEYDEKHSGKFARLREICETIAAKREKVLIFTQFKETTQPLATFLESVFGRPGLVLHGGTQVKKRSEMVKQFQSDEYVPFFVLSVKAGGTGLNLTAANHVIHFDRWWNPAVENQATDRAFRIGQKKSVVVHKFVTKGTVEERIAQMLEEKQQLSDDVLGGDGSGWITELSNDEIKNLFTLRA